MSKCLVWGACGIRFSKGLATLVLALLCSTASYGQLSTASVNGIVRDPSGSSVPQAVVVLKNVDTGVERQTISNEAGNYVFLNVPPGSYTLEASKPGFRTNRLNPFTLVVNQTATFDFALQVGSVEQSVTVEAIGAEVQSSTAELGAAVTQKQVVDLPLNGRNFTQLLSLTPGVSPVSVSQNAGGSFTASPVGSFVFPSINGQTNRSNFWMLDGVNNQESFNSTYAVPPVVDAIQEFKVQSHNDQAEFGGALGGIINVVTKSGTNELHGAAWEYIRNDAFDARNFFQANVTPFRQNQFGATGGGPVVIPKVYNGKNRTFFFLSYQGFRFRQPANTFYRVPTPANLAGDLSDWPRQIYNPFTTRPDPSNPDRFIRDPFPGNQIPQQLIDPGMVRFAQATLPAPVATGLADRNAIDTTATRRGQEEYSARIDQNVGTKDFFWFRYSGQLLDANRPSSRQPLTASDEFRSKNIGASWVHVFGPTSTLQAQMGRVRVRLDTMTRFSGLAPDFGIREVGFSDQFAGGFIDDLVLTPAISVTDFFSGGESDFLNDSVNIWQGKVNYSKIVGGHTFKMGGEINSNPFESLYRNANVGFGPFQTSDPLNPGVTGSGLASFLLNVPNDAGRRNVHETTRWGGVIGFYFHDSWRVTPKFTFNFGLRYDRTFIPPYGASDSIGENGGIETGSLDLNRGVYLVQKLPPSCAERGRAPCIPTPDGSLPAHVELEPRGKIYHDTTKNFQPRVGFAYRLAQNTALRASFGMFFDNWAAVTQTSQNYEGAWPDVGQLLAQNLNNPVPAQPTPSIKGTNPFPTGLLPAPTPFNQVQWFMDPHAKNPYSMQWNFGIQHQLNQATVITTNYVGSGSRRLDIGGFYNTALTPGPGNPRDRSPFPYIAPTFYDRSWGRSNYHALQFLLDKKFSRGLVYMVSYTWSKSIDIGCSGWYGVEGCSVQDPYHFNNDRSVSGFDVPHLLSVNWVYQLPIGQGKAFDLANKPANYILGNWQINGIASLRSGQAYSLSVSGDIPNTGNTVVRPNVVGDWEVSEPTPERWFNTSAFAPPEPFTFGNVGRNAMRADWIRNFDLSVFRQFPFAENKSIEFRAEAFNTFNTPIFGTPTSNISSTNFGRVLGTATRSRQLQLGLKLFY
jgi:outer membrane receptor protein involved in Fe transport